MQGSGKVDAAAQKKADNRREREEDIRNAIEIAKTDTVARMSMQSILECDILILAIVESYPEGYPQLAAFQSSEPSFSMYRSFGYLHSRVILNMQDELRDLEEKLKGLDEEDSAGNKKRLESRRRAGSERVNLLSKIEGLLVRYNEILMKARDMNGFQRPSNRDYRSIRRWFQSKGPLVEGEQEYIKRREDLVTLRQGREWAGFDGWIESAIKRLPEGLAEASFALCQGRHPC